MVLTEYDSDDQMKKTEMGGACSTSGKGTFRVLVRTPQGEETASKP